VPYLEIAKELLEADLHGRQILSLDIPLHGCFALTKVIKAGVAMYVECFGLDRCRQKHSVEHSFLRLEA